MKISMKLVYKYMAIFFKFSPTSSHFHPLQVENCDSNSRLAVDEDDNGKFRPERVENILVRYFQVSPPKITPPEIPRYLSSALIDSSQKLIIITSPKPVNLKTTLIKIYSIF